MAHGLPPVAPILRFQSAAAIAGARSSLQARVDSGEAPAGRIIVFPPALEQIHICRPRLISASRQPQIIAKHRPEVRMRAFVDNILRAAPCGSYLRVQRKSLFRDNAIDVVLGVVDVADIGHHAADVRPSLRRRTEGVCTMLRYAWRKKSPLPPNPLTTLEPSTCVELTCP